MIILLDLIISGYLGFLSLERGDISDYLFLFISLLNIALAYNITSNNKKLKRDMNGSFLKMAGLSQDNLHDGLTGVYNRRYFDITINKFIKKAIDFNVKFSILIIDIDHFKKFNDTYGHDVGDDVLKIVASTVKNNTRINNDMFFRFGGEEFVIITLDDLSAAVRLANKINNLDFKGSPEKITVSIGISSFREGLSKEELIKTADNNLYKAKKTGRNRAVWENLND